MVEVVSWSELVRRSGSEARARTAVRGGAYRAVLRGAYVHGGEDLAAPGVRAAAARSVLPPDAALSHRASLWLLGDDVLDAGLLDVTVRRGRHLQQRAGLRVHSASLPDEDLVVVTGLLATSAARAVVDVARSSPVQVGVAFGDRALRLGAARLPDVQRVLQDASELRGVRRARVAVGLLDGRSESWMESLLRVSLYVGGLRDLDVQYDVWTASGHVGRADLHHDGVWVEFDGRRARLERVRFTDDRRRQTRIAEAGFELRRYTADDVLHRPAGALVAELRRAAALAARRDRSSVVPGPDTLRRPALTPLPDLAGLRAA